MIGSLVDGAQVISTVRFRERETTNRAIELAVANHAKSGQTDRVPYPYVRLRKIRNIFLARAWYVRGSNEKQYTFDVTTTPNGGNR